MIKTILFTLLYSCLSLAQSPFTNVDQQRSPTKNMIYNGGFENGKQKWTASGGTFTVGTGSFVAKVGTYYGSWDSNGASQTLTATVIDTPFGYRGRPGYATCKFSGGSVTHKFQVYDTSNSVVLAEQSLSSVNTDTATLVGLNFAYAAAGNNVTIRVISVASDENTIYIDDCYVGPAEGYNIVLSRPQDVFSAFISGTNPDGNGVVSRENVDWISGNCTNADPKVCTFVSGIFTTAPNCYMSAYDASGGLGVFEINAVSSTSITIDVNRAAAAGDAATARALYLVCQKTSTDALQPALRPDQVAMSWSGYHDSTCSWARTNTAYGDPTADATCTLTERTNSNFGTVSTYTVTNAMPGIVFTPKRAGKYLACVGFTFITNGVANAIRLYDVSSSTTIADVGQAITNGLYTSNQICGIVTASDTSAKTIALQTSSASGTVTIAPVGNSQAVSWTLVAIDTQLPAPLLINSVVNPRSGVTRIVSAYISYTAGVPSATRQDGGAWISSVADNSTGDFTLNIAAGVFSDTPNCVCTQQDAASGACNIDDTTTPSSTVYRFQQYNMTPAAVDRNAIVICIGPA